MLRQERTGENMAKTPFPSIFYVYGNKSYQDEIEAAIANISNNYTSLNISNPSGCGFKLESFDIGDMKSLDIILETYEAWIQPNRRTEFTEINSDFLDLDSYTVGCNNRISTDDRNFANFAIKSYLPSVVCVRSLSYLGSGVSGSYTLYMGGDTIKNAVPINASITDNRIYRKTLTPSKGFDLQVADCILNNAMVEFKGKSNTSEWTFDNPYPTGTPMPSEIVDEDFSTWDVVPWDNYPRAVFNHPLCSIKNMNFYIYISGTSGDTFRFDPSSCYAFDASTTSIVKDLYPAMNAQHPLMVENVGYSFYIPVGVNATQLRFAIQSVEHPSPALPSPLPEFRFLQMIIATN